MKLFVLFFALFLSLSVSGQSTTTIAPDGSVNVTIENVGGKDPVWSGISLLTSKGVKSRQNSVVVVDTPRFTFGYETTYNKDTKTYSTTLSDGSVLNTTTIAAIRAAINTDAYRKETGRNPAG